MNLCFSWTHTNLEISFPFSLIGFTFLCNLAFSSPLEWNAWADPSSEEGPVSFRSWAAEPTWKDTDTLRPHLLCNCYSLTLGRWFVSGHWKGCLVDKRPAEWVMRGPWCRTAWVLWWGKQNVHLCTFKDILKTSSNKSACEKFVFPEVMSGGIDWVACWDVQTTKDRMDSSEST